MEQQTYTMRFTNVDTNDSFGLIVNTSDFKHFIKVIKSYLGEHYYLDNFALVPNNSVYVVHPFCRGCVEDLELDNMLDIEKTHILL